MTHITTKKQKWEKEFDRDYTTLDDKCVGIIASALTHARIEKAGTDASYMTVKLRKIIEEELEAQAEGIRERVEKERKDTSCVNTNPGGSNIGCKTCRGQEDCRCDDFNEGIDLALQAISPKGEK